MKEGGKMLRVETPKCFTWAAWAGSESDALQWQNGSFAASQHLTTQWASQRPSDFETRRSILKPFGFWRSVRSAKAISMHPH